MDGIEPLGMVLDGSGRDQSATNVFVAELFMTDLAPD